MQFNFVTKDTFIVNNVEMHKVKSKVGQLSSGMLLIGPGWAGGRAVPRALLRVLRLLRC